MHVFPNKKLRSATVSMSIFFLALFFSSGCANNEKTTANPLEVDRVELTPAEQAEVNKYVREHGRDAIMYYFDDELAKLEKKLNEVADTKTGEELMENFGAWLEEAKKLAHVEDRRILNHVKYFVAQGVDVNANPEMSGRNTLLQTVVIFDNLELVQFLVLEGIDVNAKGEHGFTPMALAAVYGHDKIVRFLVSKGADVNAKDSLGQTPLCWAVVNGRFEIVKFLVSKGADVNAKNNDGRTPLYWADSFPQIAKFLVSKGAKRE